MTADTSVSSELESLQRELSLSRQQRTRVGAPTDSDPPSTAEQVDTAEDEDWGADLRALADEATKFFEEAEKNISAHPASSVVGALLIGILIGRLLGKH